MRVFRRVMASWTVVLVACTTQVFAQTGMANMVDHIHLAVPDQAKGVEWYRKHFGGQPMTEAPERLMFGETRIIFQRNESAQPSSGSVLDHASTGDALGAFGANGEGTGLNGGCSIVP